MSAEPNAATQVARDYYNSDDADRFYAEVWGGEDIHIGMYRTADESIKEASRRTVDHMADRLNGIGESSVVMDIGSGYGGAARRLVERFGCQVICINLAEAENERNRQLNQEYGVANRIQVIDGSFEELPSQPQSIDAVWSQDAILHAGNRCRVLQEVDRVLRPGGQFVFTDPMQSDNCPEGVLEPILARIHLADLGSPGFYQGVAADLGWSDLGFEDHTNQLTNHYSRVRQVTEARTSDLSKNISPEYLARMKAGLQHWIDGGENRHLCWGVFSFQKN